MENYVTMELKSIPKILLILTDSTYIQFSSYNLIAFSVKVSYFLMNRADDTS